MTPSVMLSIPAVQPLSRPQLFRFTAGGMDANLGFVESIPKVQVIIFKDTFCQGVVHPTTLCPCKPFVKFVFGASSTIHSLSDGIFIFYGI